MRRFLVLTSFLFIFGVIAAPVPSYADVDLSVSFDLFSPPPVAVAPPPMPVYIVPEPPVENYVWAPGHWLWADYGYFWVPGTWVQPPTVGYLWTPGYWGWHNGYFAWNEGYWGPHVGFYGGVNYGGGYDGHGFHGGEWHGNVYNVNRSVTNVTNITNVTYVNTTSFNGGPGGITAAPTHEQEVAAHEHHIEATQEQRSHAQDASRNPAFAESNNHGRPAIAATTKAGDFNHGVIAARQAGAPNPAAEQHNAEVRANPAMAKGAALPRQQATRQEPVGAARMAEPVQQHEVQTHEAVPMREPDSHPRNQPFHPDVMRDVHNEPAQAHEPAAPAHEVAPHEVQPTEPAHAPAMQTHAHEPDAHPRNQPFHPEEKEEPRKEPAGEPHEEPGQHP